MECRGTGAEDPDCWLCKGDLTIKIEEAQSEGYSLDDLQGLADDEYCDCPVCERATCDFCEGDGRVWPEVNEQQERRVLLMALNGGEIPSLIYQSFDGPPVIDRDALLSKEAAARCREKDEITWFCSVFGDEIGLTKKGCHALLSVYDDGTQGFATVEGWDEIKIGERWHG